MVITNFSSGELSQTLFGRIDLPQYYNGASRLENFDVIPTGGIQRRIGMKRLAGLEGDGRIIPFLVDRESHYLLYLTPERGGGEGEAAAKAMIRVYLNGELMSAVEDSEEAPLHRTLAEIHEVQYAQNADTMILAHPGYAPLQVGNGNGFLYIQKFFIKTDVELKVTGNVNAANFAEEDGAYAGGWLRTEGNHPACVTFFNGRLVFAGTHKNRQRVFASRVGDIHDFSTYKKYLTEQREYVVVQGTVSPSKSDTVAYKGGTPDFRYSPERYYIDSGLFDPDTKIREISGGNIYLSKPANFEIFDTASILAEISGKQSQFISWRNSGVREKIAFLKTDYIEPSGEYQYLEQVTYYLDVYVDKIAIGCVVEWDMWRGSQHTHKVEPYAEQKKLMLPEDAAALHRNDGGYFARAVNNFCDGYFSTDDSWNVVGDFYTTVMEKKRYPDGQIRQISTVSGRVLATMTYALSTKKGPEYYDGHPDDIYIAVDNRINASSDKIIAFYAVNVLEQRYPTPDVGFTFEIASDMSDAIRWIGQNKHILVGTETGEWVIPAGTTATNVQAILNSRYGSDKIQGTAVGDAVCFFQSGRRAVVEYYIPQQDDNFRANNMALLNPEMLRESPAFDFDFISAPYTKIFISREDGAIAALLYERGTGTFAWNRITTAGEVKSVATLPGPSGYDDVYLLVKRGEGYFLELLDEREQVFLDSGGVWAGQAGEYGPVPGRDGEQVAAVVYDATDGVAYGTDQPPIAGHDMRVGYPYRSTARSMPVIANDKMKQNVIKNLIIRFDDSHMPRVRSLPNDVEDVIPQPDDRQDLPYTGVVKINFPGAWDYDVFFEFLHDAPTRCRILSVNAEAN